MGCHCGYSLCSICGNKAQLEDDFCEHIANYKGSTFNGYPVFEDNREVSFFECSIVSIPADPDAKILERVACRMTKHNHAIGNSHNDNSIANIIRNEKNQRTIYGRTNSLAERLKNLPWS